MMNSLNWTLCDSYSPKQIALFQSVTSLLEEGVATSDMKVSEIAARAGVGKGTTYEYFSSKEELIARAIFYDVSIRITELAQRVNETQGFKNMFFTILNWLEENIQAKHVVNRILGMDNMLQNGTTEICNMLRLHTQEMEYIQQGIAGLIHVAEEENLISPNVPESLKNLSFINQMFSYVAYLKMQENITDVSKNQIKEFLYNSLIRALQV